MSIQDDLMRRLRHHGLDKAYLGSVVCQAAKDVAAGEFEPISFKNGTLKVRVDNPAKGQIVFLRQKDYIAKINKKMGAPRILKLFIVVQEKMHEE